MDDMSFARAGLLSYSPVSFANEGYPQEFTNRLATSSYPIPGYAAISPARNNIMPIDVSDMYPYNSSQYPNCAHDFAFLMNEGSISSKPSMVDDSSSVGLSPKSMSLCDQKNPRITDRRREQNRQSQRKFRQRKEELLVETMARIEILQEELGKMHSENGNLQQRIEGLRRQNESLRRLSVTDWSWSEEAISGIGMAIGGIYTPEG